ncbi:hypothetical protein [Reinekea blandensis]|uniref:Outer membrane protein beta-barrel domain-containing protein n=1 Tax=Reinekea blandensis MED297 TaxID=314283 RepID=A4BAD8_9GAMM|nr:hypothetical protein [Reinekea blandensis]EAR10894.1 hypothetical protein MED297_10301 [Reinekea sp. MED297] [Reinekea blandensis MED297]
MRSLLTNYLSAAVLVFASGILATQVVAKESLIDMDNARVGGFGGPLFKVSQIQNEQTFEIGGMGGATFTTGKHSIMLGGGGYGLVNELGWNNGDKLDMGYGGLMLGYTYDPEALVHVDTTLLLGAGGVTTIDTDTDISDTGSFLITELSAAVEVNLTEFLEIGVGGAYRLASDPSLPGLNSNDLSKPSVFISFQFGSL